MSKDNEVVKLTRLGNRRVFHYLFVCVVIGLFAFFLTSRLWISVETAIAETPIGTVHKISSSASVTLKSWRLQEDSSAIVDIGISDISAGSEFSYSVGAYNEAGKAISMEIVHVDNGFLIMRIPDAVRQKALTISLQVQENSLDGTAKGKAKTYRFTIYTDSLADSETIPTIFSEMGYMLFDMQADLALLYAEQLQYEQDIRANQTLIENTRQKIETQLQSQQYKTEEEVAESNKQIEQLEKAIAAAEKENQKLNESLFNLEDEIHQKLKKIEEYKAGNGI